MLMLQSRWGTSITLRPPTVHPAYKTQRHVTAIIDIAADGTLAGVELIDDMPPPPAADRLASTQVEGLELETTGEERKAALFTTTMSPGWIPAELSARLLRDIDRSLARLGECHAGYQTLKRELAAERDRAERMEGALVQIDQWSQAYPLSVFPEPDFTKAAEALKAAGMTLDAISASNMRHVVEGVGNIARAALAQDKEKSNGRV